MTEIATQQPAPQSVLAEISGEAFQQQLAAALPPGITPERFARITVTALIEDQSRQRDPKKQLLACDRASLYQAVIKCAQDGLLPDGRQAALVKRGDKVVYQPMVFGLRAIAAEYGWTIRGQAVRARDEFDWQDEPPSLFHKVFTGGDRGELCYAYAVARHRDGRREQRVMTRDEVLKRAKSATTDQVWTAWPDEMWAKTPVRDLFQELPLDPAERARLMRVLAANPVDELPAPSAAEQLYGPSRSEATADSPASEPAAAEATPQSPSAAAPPDDEPEPGPDPEPPAAPEPAADPQAAVNAAAEEASRYVPPNGKYAAGGQLGPKTLQEILEQGEAGAKWLAWALGKIDAPPDYATAVWAYARVFAPGLYQEALARKEALA